MISNVLYPNKICYKCPQKSFSRSGDYLQCSRESINLGEKIEANGEKSQENKYCISIKFSLYDKAKYAESSSIERFQRDCPYFLEHLMERKKEESEND